MNRVKVIGIFFQILYLNQVLSSENIAAESADRIFRKWNDGIIPVEIRGNFSTTELDMINKAIDIFHDQTCVHFRQHTNEKDFVIIANTPSGCWAHQGHIGGPQMLNIESPKCTQNISTFQHKILQLLGYNNDMEQPSRAINRSRIDDYNESYDDYDSDNNDQDNNIKPNNEITNQDIQNIVKLYECKKPTGIQPPLKLTTKITFNFQFLG